MNFYQYSPIDFSRVNAELAPVAACLDPERPDAWSDIAESLFVTLKAQPLLERLSPEELAQMAVSQTYQLMHDMGGQALYLGVGHTLMARMRKRCVIAEFNGKNIAELSKKHGVTPSRVRQMLSEDNRSRRGRSSS